MLQMAAPRSGAGQALVRVEATAVSFAESAMRRGRYFGQPAFPFVPGYDLVGVVEAVGPDVDRALIGKRFAALTKTGAWATAVLLPAADLVAVPDGVSAEEAETLTVNGLTAYQMLHHVAKVQAGQTVLVLGVGGGVGTLLAQLARHTSRPGSGNWLPAAWTPCSTTSVARASPAPTGCSTAPEPWFRFATASRASSTTVRRWCSAS